MNSWLFDSLLLLIWCYALVILLKIKLCIPCLHKWKAAKQSCAEENKKTSFEEMNATSMRIRALAHRDSISFNIIKQFLIVMHPRVVHHEGWGVCEGVEGGGWEKGKGSGISTEKKSFFRRWIKKMQRRSWNSVLLCLPKNVLSFYLVL